MMESSVQLDHIATWNEVRDALEYSSRDAFDLLPARDGDVELKFDLSSGVGCLSEDLAWLRVAREALDSRSN
ncbi:MAG TPA: hypothetical protein VN087_09470 [Verrucomicrobiae bacterium]|jgi:hypothetical protein|nr:hypothetical protein [Verrucomicrobiae bacterium]